MEGTDPTGSLSTEVPLSSKVIANAEGKNMLEELVGDAWVMRLLCQAVTRCQGSISVFESTVGQRSISGCWDHVTNDFAMWLDKMAGRK